MPKQHTQICKPMKHPIELFKLSIRRMHRNLQIIYDLLLIIFLKLIKYFKNKFNI